MYKYNFENIANGLDLLDTIEKGTIKCIFFDPQYRGVLDKMNYGNEGKQRGKGRSSLTQMPVETIKKFIDKIDEVLAPNGYLFLWVDKFHLVEGIDWFQGKDLHMVDLITWNKKKMGMGYRTRRVCEYLIIVQKSPKTPKNSWSIHNIPDCWDEKVKKNHPHSKPILLQEQLIKAVTNEGDIVVDPASGGYSVMKAAMNTNRVFYGCDIEFGSDENDERN